VAASPGDTAGYSARVRARVASNRPSGSGARGTVTIAFRVSASGAIVSASIAGSSGDAAFDRAALAAVRSAGPFGPTPTGAGLSFNVPFHSR
jgi:protein TonB